jgi:hypothetical protein
MLKNFFRVLMVAVLLWPSLMTSAAQADTITFKMRSFASSPVSVKFHSTSRKVVWPAGGKVWTLKDYKVIDIKLTCVTGEKICYGGFDARRSWGVGRDGKAGCASCCATCSNNSVTRVFDLNN